MFVNCAKMIFSSFFIYFEKKETLNNWHKSQIKNTSHTLISLSLAIHTLTHASMVKCRDSEAQHDLILYEATDREV